MTNNVPATQTQANTHNKVNFFTLAVTAFSITVALAIFFKNAWVGDDAYITFRIVEQLFAGNGPNFNPHERAMVYTSPAWYWLLCAGRLFTTDLYAVSIALSFVLWAVALAVIKFTLKGWLPFALATLLMVSSNGFYDFTTSGLENPLGYLTIAIYGAFYLRRLDGKNDAIPLLLTMGAATLVRHDIATLLLIPTAYAAWQDREKRALRQWTIWTAIALAPIAAWTTFSLLYYGFPFPNTMYAKMYIDLPRHAVVLNHGLDYWMKTLQGDPVTVLTILAASVMALTAPKTVRGPTLALTAGIMMNCAYITYVGGDFMIGRFLSFAFLVSIFTIYLCARDDGTRQAKPTLWYGRLAAVLVALATFSLATHTPLNSSADHQTDAEPIGAVDERGWYFPATSLNQYMQMKKSGATFPLMRATTTGLGIQADQSNRPAYHVSAMGIVSYHAGVDKVIFDQYALSSPLVARMNAHPKSRVGHYYRHISDGVMTAHELGPEAIRDPAVQRYYRRMSLVTESPNLFAPQRLREILLLNTVNRRLKPTHGDPWDEETSQDKR